MQWRYSESSADVVKEIDTESSPHVVYVRKGIKQIFKKNTDGSEVSLWGYQELIVKKEDWVIFEELIHSQSKIDDLGDNLVDSEMALVEQYENNLALMDELTNTQLALTELYELLVDGTE